MLGNVVYKKEYDKTLFSNLIRDLVDVERHYTFKVQIIHIFKSSRTVMSDLFWYIFFSNLLLNAGLPIVHCNAFFLLGCVVVQNVAIGGSVKCAWPENNWRICSYSKWWVLMPIYLFFHKRFMYLMCVANGRQETWFHLLLTHVWLMLANFVNMLTLTWSLFSVAGEILQSWAKSSTPTLYALARQHLLSRLIPFQYLPLALPWMDGYANGIEKHCHGLRVWLTYCVPH